MAEGWGGRGPGSSTCCSQWACGYKAPRHWSRPRSSPRSSRAGPPHASAGPTAPPPRSWCSGMQARGRGPRGPLGREIRTQGQSRRSLGDTPPQALCPQGLVLKERWARRAAQGNRGPKWCSADPSPCPQVPAWLPKGIPIRVTPLSPPEVTHLQSSSVTHGLC